MQRNQKKISITGVFVFGLALLNALIIKQGYVDHPDWYALLAVTLPLLLISVILYKAGSFKEKQ